MKKAVIAFFCVVLILSSLTVRGGDRNSGLIVNTVAGKVIEVIDGDAIAVRLTNGTIAYVKLLGIKASTKEGGLKYMQDNVFGNMVVLVPDFTGSVSAMEGRFNYCYVYLSPNGTTSFYGNESLNLNLLRFGYAEVDQRFKGIDLYNTFSTYQAQAKALNAGLWGGGLAAATITGDKVNVNTASVSVLQSFMTKDTSDTVIRNITYYRDKAAYKSISDLKFVKGMTKEIYTNNRHIFTVMTNINTASEKELRTLDGINTEIVDAIIKYRMSEKFSSLKDLYNKAGVDRDFYDRNRYYMCVSDDDEVTVAKPVAVVNVNTASLSQLRSVSPVSLTLATRIISGRSNGYTYKSLGEIAPLYNLTADDINGLSDNLHIYTDVNTATYEELESLYGDNKIARDIDNIINQRTISDITRLKSVLNDDRYARIEKHIYAGTFRAPDRVNLNTATESELRGAGMTMTEARSVLALQGKMITPSQIPFNISEYDKNVSLYTDVNTASEKELRSLNIFSESVLAQFINYREDQPFGSVDEVEAFFEEVRQLNAYRKIRDFITVR